MNKLLLFLFIILSIPSYSQDKSEIKELFWGKTDSFKNVTKIPEKWKNESAVIIYKYEHYSYHNSGIRVIYTSAFRKRIKLQDKAAIKEFSEFSFNDKFNSSKGFRYKQGTTFLGVKIIKPNGDEIEIDVDKNAKKLDEEKKLAINNLEIGDILDYYYYSYEPFLNELYSFEPVENTLGDVYPIMKKKIRFTTEEDFYVSFCTYNGAPKLKDVPSEKKRVKQYELEAEDIEKNEFPRWFYPFAEMPCYKFKVYFSKNKALLKNNWFMDAFISKDGTLKDKVSKEDVLELYKNKFYAIADLGATLKFLKGKTFENDEEKVKAVYEFARHQYFTQYLESSVIDEAKIFNPFELYKTPMFLNNQRSFVYYFMAFMKEFKIDYNIVIATSRYNGSIDDLLIPKNATIILRINTEKPFYIECFNPFSTPGSFDSDIEKTKAYTLGIKNNKEIASIDEILLPSSTAKDNVTKVKTTVSLNSDLTDLNVKRMSSFYGHFKNDEQGRMMNFYDYLDEDYEKFKTERVLDKVGNKKKQEQYRKEYEALLSKLRDKQGEDEKKAISAEFDFEIEKPILKILNTGRYGENTPFSYEQEFNIKNNLIKKAGENYIVEIGKILTGQVEIDKKEIDRKNNIYMSFPRSFENEIVFEIPVGYKVSGIEKLNKNVENSTGQFTSSAVLTDNKLVITTKKQYNNYYEPNSNWKDMISFLEAAYQFTQEKILLKKQ